MSDRIKIPPEYLSLLDDLGTSEYEHMRGTFRDHLIGTYELLVDWGSPLAVAVGGLFHSIYGTQFFRVSSADLDSRAQIAAVIGHRAEELAYLFCVTDRTGFFYEADKAEPRLWNRVHEELIAVEPNVIRDLIEIEVANYIEQFDQQKPLPRRTISSCKHMLIRGRDRMTERAYDAFAKMIEAIPVASE